MRRVNAHTMKRIYRTIQYFISAARNRSLRYAIRRVSPLEEDKQSPRIASLSAWLAKRYRRYANSKEKLRVWRYGLEKEKQEHQILKEVINYSKRVLGYLFVALALGWLMDVIYWWIHPALAHVRFIANNFSTIPPDALQTGLTIYVGAISGLLGLIFALYAVGFQLSTERYSANVTGFMNEERVSSYFFSLLIFTDLFAVATFVRLHFTKPEPVASFLFATVLVSLCFLGVIIFKRHYIESMKPTRVFQRIWQLFLEMFPGITAESGYKTKSWSIAMGARQHSKRYFNIFGSLYRDLIRNNKLDDASYGPLILGRILRDYLSNKRFIDTEHGWWADQKLDQPKADNTSLSSIKSAYEIQGRGPFFTTKQDNEWFEAKALELLKQMRDTAIGQGDDKMLTRVSDGYKDVLVGDRERTAGDPVDIPGAWQNQEFATFNSALQDFLELVNQLDFTNESSTVSILNDYFAVAVTAADKWDVEPAVKVLGSFYDDDQLNQSRNYLGDRKIAAEARKLLLSYWMQLEVEQKLEGKLITPKEQWISAFRKTLGQTLKDQTQAVFTTFFDNSTAIVNKLLQVPNQEYVGQFIKMQMVWMSRMLYEDQKEIAERFASVLGNNVRQLLLLPKTLLDELEILDQAERGFFVAIYEEQPGLIEAYFKALVLIRLVIMQTITEPEEMARYHRLTVLWGGALFVLAELRQDYTLLEKYVVLLNTTYQNGLPKVVEIVKDYRPTNLIGWEVNRYHQHYMNLARKLQRELQEESYHESVNAIGVSTRYAHPSPFIQNLAQFDIDIQDRAIKGFADWVREWDLAKKRAAIAELTELLSRMKDQGNAQQ
jgi:hypothetical protein